MVVRRFLCPFLLGREGETELLETALDKAGTGAGGVVLISGEAGVGKSRLVRELVTSARERRVSVLTGRAMESCSPPAFGPFTEALLSYFRASAPPSVPELEPFRPALARVIPQWRAAAGISPEQSLVVLAEAIVRLLSTIAKSQGCLLILEDLHWADPETLAIVDYFSDALDSERVLCVGTLRSGESGQAGALQRSLHARRCGQVIELRRLDDTQVQTMTSACLGDTAVDVKRTITRFADGLPFLVEELLAAWSDTGDLVLSDKGWVLTAAAEPVVPETFVDTVRRRLATIGDPARLVLGAAAVFGRRFDWQLLVRATALDEGAVLETLRRAVTAQLCVAESLDAGAFRFRHALTRHAVLGELLPVERKDLAARLLSALEGTNADLSGDAGQNAVELAHAAGDDVRAARLLQAAAAEARSRGALSTAEAFLRRARSAVAVTDECGREIDQELTEVLVAAGKPQAALEVGDRLCRPGSGLGPSQLAALHVILARAATLAGLWPDAEEHVGAVRSCAPPSDSALQAEADLVQAEILMAHKRPTQATDLARGALAAAQEAARPAIAGEALMLIGRAERLRDLTLARAAFSDALEWATTAGSVECRIRAAFELATISQLEGESIDPLLEVRTAAHDAGVPVTAAYVDLMLAHRHEDQIELDCAQEAAQRCVDAARRYRLDPLLGSASTQLAFAHGALGDRGAMEEALATASAVAGDDPDVLAGSCIARGMVALLSEDRAHALRHFDAAMDVLRSSHATYPAPHRALWALLHVVEDDDVAEDAVAEVKASPATVHHAVRGLLACADAVCLGRAGRQEEADEAWATGDALLCCLEGRRNIARRLSAESAIQHGWGQPVTWLGLAADFFDVRGVPRMASACRSLLRTTGVPVPRRSVRDDTVPAALRQHGVTRREMEVLDLLADGMSSSAIAARLYLSVKTVERHTANLAMKLGLTGRAQVVAFGAAQRASAAAGRAE